MPSKVPKHKVGDVVVVGDDTAVIVEWQYEAIIDTISYRCRRDRDAALGIWAEDDVIGLTTR